ncbi:methionine biosynthesis protein MetW [Propionibacterium cyclohexanicum]|uniref:Methionine biosynthesis protein MetW n=1 Tax=Propionibacterium cyclohexanicum TaxID=64702 RepID=A0A1H9TFZ1_9ACTN|nr:methionine biosynthesis protein MetW [Propionibacterium cyclohexanicum]SER95739.1 methionine biosynthesis protein MetW [Propionibacterium cyclohexanicum]
MTDSYDRAQGVLLRQDLQWVASLIEAGSNVLDLGCGDGELLEYLMSTRGCRGTGVERDPQAVLQAISRAVPVVELDLDVQLGEFGDDSFDVVVLSRTLQAVVRPKEVLQQMRRIAQRMIVTMPNFGYWRHRLRLLGGKMPQSKDLPYSWYDTPNLHHTTLLTLEELFDDVGLAVRRRIPLNGDGRPPRLPIGWTQRSANLLAGSAIYVLERRT